MATKDQITVSNPTYGAEASSFARVVEKGKEKQEKQLAQLRNVLKIIEEELVEAKAGVSAGSAPKQEEKVVPLRSGSNNNDQGPSNTEFEDAMAAFAMAMEMLQVKLAKFSNQNATSEAELSKAYVNLTQEIAKEVQKKLKKIHKEEEKRKHASFWEKIGEAVLGVATIIVGFALAQPEIVAMGALSLVAATGVFEKATKYVAEFLHNVCGWKNEEGCQIVAAVFVCLTTIALATMAGDPEEAVEETAETATEVGEAATDAAEGVENLEKEVSALKQTMQSIADSPVGQVASKIGEGVSKFNKFLGMKGRLAVLAALQSSQGTDVINRIADAIMIKEGISEAKRAEIKAKLGYAMMAITIAASMAVVSGASGATKFSSAGYRLGKAISLGQKVSYNLGNLGLASANVYQGTVNIEQGKLEGELGLKKGMLELFTVLMGMNTEQMKTDQKFTAQSLKNQRVGNRSISQLMKGEAGFANLFTMHSPV